MPSSSMYRRPLGRDSAHRISLLRNLVTALFKEESISTTWAKAKEAQSVAEKLITLGKRDTEATRRQAQSMVFEPEIVLPKLFGTLKNRYANRPGGYTRILRCEPLKDDSAKSAILSLVDGPKDMRFSMTAKALLRQQQEELPMNDITASNIRKVTRFRKDGVAALAQAVKDLEVGQKEMKEREQKEFTEKGTRFKWTSELRRSDPRWIEKRGPGRMVRRRIEKDDTEDVDR